MDIKELLSNIGSLKEQINNEAEEYALSPMQAMQKIVAFESCMTRPCPFSIGEWVTPKEGVGVKGHGNPHRVIAAYDCMQITPSGRAGSSCVYYDMLILDVCPVLGVYPVTHYVAIYAAYSVDYEPYTGIRPEDIDVD